MILFPIEVPCPATGLLLKALDARPSQHYNLLGHSYKVQKLPELICDSPCRLRRCRRAINNSRVPRCSSPSCSNREHCQHAPPRSRRSPPPCRSCTSTVPWFFASSHHASISHLGSIPGFLCRPSKHCANHSESHVKFGHHTCTTFFELGPSFDWCLHRPPSRSQDDKEDLQG